MEYDEYLDTKTALETAKERLERMGSSEEMRLRMRALLTPLNATIPTNHGIRGITPGTDGEWEAPLQPPIARPIGSSATSILPANISTYESASKTLNPRAKEFKL